MKKVFSMVTLQKLINYYSQAIEYYESICDPRFARYSKSLQLLLMQPEVMKHITLQSSKGKIKVQKQERKKEIMDELHNVDKKFEKDNKDIHNLIAQKNAPEKKEDINKVINNVLDEQTNNFKKKLEEKKKRKLLTLNEESGSNDKSNSIEEKEKKQEKEEEENMQVKKIKLVIDYKVDSFENLFEDCSCIESINFKKFHRKDRIYIWL